MNEEILKEEQQIKPEDIKANSAGENTQTGPDPDSGSSQDEANKYKAQAEEYLQLAQRVQADFDNFRRRTVQEREDLIKYGSMRLVSNLLPTLDNFERAMSAAANDVGQLREGIELIHRQLLDALGKEGVKPMDTVGQEFDPNFHEAVMQAPSEEHRDNIIMEEFQKGYMLAERVIRPAMVKVAKS